MLERCVFRLQLLLLPPCEPKVSSMSTADRSKDAPLPRSRNMQLDSLPTVLPRKEPAGDIDFWRLTWRCKTTAAWSSRSVLLGKLVRQTRRHASSRCCGGARSTSTPVPPKLPLSLVTGLNPRSELREDPKGSLDRGVFTSLLGSQLCTRTLSPSAEESCTASVTPRSAQICRARSPVCTAVTLSKRTIVGLNRFSAGTGVPLTAASACKT
mmetsp:Transcript_61527/g.170594  ORF Transcript_61527/g.170594 Transcript_61527/m.170594 type:complete len:211 (-) Transcript_61527:163-795(-)